MYCFPFQFKLLKILYVDLIPSYVYVGSVVPMYYNLPFITYSFSIPYILCIYSSCIKMYIE